MSTATAAEEPVVVPAVRGKKKLIIIAAAVAVLVLAAGGGAAAYLMKGKSAAAQVVDADAEGEDAVVAEADVTEPAPPVEAEPNDEHRAAPVFVPLDPFTVNLADRNSDRYAQVGITLEIDNAKTGDRIKAFMPVIRNNILMAIADRSAEELLAREGKAQLAERVRRETSRAMGYAVAADDAAAKGAAKAGQAAPALPVKAVHFSNFIVQ